MASSPVTFRRTLGALAFLALNSLCVVDCVTRGGFDGLGLPALVFEVGLLAGVFGRGAWRRFGMGAMMSVVGFVAFLFAAGRLFPGGLDGLANLYTAIAGQVFSIATSLLPEPARDRISSDPNQTILILSDEAIRGFPAAVLALGVGSLSAFWRVVFPDYRARPPAKKRVSVVRTEAPGSR